MALFKLTVKMSLVRTCSSVSRSSDVETNLELGDRIWGVRAKKLKDYKSHLYPIVMSEGEEVELVPNGLT
jgi:hypothetical protein